MDILPVTCATPFSMGIKLEVQLLKRDEYTLAIDVPELSAGLDAACYSDQIRPQAALGMVEIRSGVHERSDQLLEDLQLLRHDLMQSVSSLGVEVAGGGTHPFQCLRQHCDLPGRHLQDVHERYGYLARTSTVFGQHIHIGVANGDDALYLTHGLAQFVPHFIALSAASPFYQGRDTAFDSTRSTIVHTFPLAGTIPLVTRWREFESCYRELREIGIIRTLKDFYWDIRPTPEFGTVEVRVCDTPLTMEHAVLMASYAQLLARWLLTDRPFVIHDNFYSCYQSNRYAASRYGLHGEIGALHDDASASIKQPLFYHLLDCLKNLKRFAQNKFEQYSLEQLSHIVTAKLNHSRHLRNAYRQRQSLRDVARLAARWWTMPDAVTCAH